MNLSELKRLAEGAKAVESYTQPAWGDYIAACDPDTILALLSAIERAREALEHTAIVLERVLSYKPVRDATETLDAARSALTELDRLMEGT